MVTLTDSQIEAVKSQLELIHGNCLYSAQAYFEASKRAELWGRLMIFIPACLSAVSGFMAAFGDKAFWGGMAAVSGAVAATASFLGGTKKAADFLISARAYTILRHRVKLELQLLSADADYAEVRQCVEDLNREYTQIVASDIPVPNRSFTVASRRIDAGAAS